VIFDILKKINYLVTLTVGRKLIFLFLFLSLVIVIFELASLASFLPLISAITNIEKVSYDNIFLKYFSFNNLLSKVELCIILLLSFFLIKNFIVYIATRIINKIGLNFLNNLNNKILNLYLNQDYSFFLANNSSRLINICGHHSRIIKNILESIIYLFIEILVNITILVTLLIYIGKLTFLLILFFSFFIYFYITTIRKKFLKLGKEQQASEFIIIRILTETFNSIKELYVFNKKDVFINLFNDHRKLLSKNEMNQSNLNFLPKFWVEFFVVFGFSILVSYYSLFHSLSDLNFTLAIFGVAILRFVPGTNKILLLYQRIIITKASIDLIYNDFANLKLQKVANIENNSIGIVFNNISFNNVSFKYDSSKDFILKNINLKISQGDMIAFCGDSGSGKTTFLDIFLGLLEPNEGNIKINDKDFYLMKNFWKKNIGYIPQNPHLFDESILNNITFFQEDKEIDNRMLDKVIDMCQINHFINDLPYGIKTIIGDKGARISGGQKQRLAIARALYQSPQILVFDESTNALDFKNEADILESIKNLNIKYGITILFVTHKLDLIKDFKYIYKVEKQSLIKYK
jgi:ABC-type multidrug transport system fused ATPase/permease subunit